MSTCLPTPTAPSVLLSSPSQFSAPTPSTYVKRNGTRLQLDGQDFVAVGPNAYWLALDENIEPWATIPSRGRVLELMSVASAMGANTIRAHTVGINYGTDRSTENALGQFSERGLAAVDWAVFAAKSYGLRLIVPLAEQYDYYHGGIPTFLRWRNLSADNFEPFYDLNSPVYSDFVQYVTTLLTHRSNITGLTLAEEPTVLAFETGNELGGWGGSHYPPPTEWTRSIAQLIKRLGPEALVASGRYGVSQDDLDIQEIDIVSDHYYPPYNYNLRRAADKAFNGNKVFIAGEFDWTDKWHKPLLYLVILAPAVIAALILLLPARWWPWRISLGCFCCRGRRRRRTVKGYRGVQDERTLEGPEHQKELMTASTTTFAPDTAYEPVTSYPPTTPRENSTSILDRGFNLRRWHFSLFILLLCAPLGAIVHVYMPNSTSQFLSQLESLAANGKLSGSFYWSLFGRDGQCCGYVQHNDGFTLHYPADPAAATGEQLGSGSRVADLTRHAWTMRRQAPSWLAAGATTNDIVLRDLPVVQCPQNTLTLPTNTNGTWTGGLGGLGDEL